jgi:hypothetical protein
MVRIARLWAAVGVAIGISSGLAHASTVVNAPNGGDPIQYWGPSAVGGGQSYGLVFTAPDSELLDFSLTVSDDGGSSYPFVSQVYAWNGSQTSGAALYTSGVDTTTSTMTTYTFTSDIGVTPGDQYIAFVTNQPGGTSLGGSGVGFMEQGTGPATFMYAEGDPSAPGDWFPYGSNASFNADFSSGVSPGVPEPSTWALLLLGFAGIGFAGYRRSRKMGAALA